MPIGLCVVCLGYANCKRCECGAGWYCSRSCQRFDWDISEEPHRDVCPIVGLREVCQTYDLNKDILHAIKPFLFKTHKKTVAIRTDPS